MIKMIIIVIIMILLSLTISQKQDYNETSNNDTFIINDFAKSRIIMRRVVMSCCC